MSETKAKELQERKDEVRTAMRALRAAVGPAERERRAEVVSDRLVDLLRRKGTVLAFLSFGDEMPTDAIIDRLASNGHKVAVPHVDGDQVTPVAYGPGDAVEHAVFGIREPADLRPVPYEEIEAVLVPGLAFDRAGYRVGYGGGFYDRLLPKLKKDVLLIGIGYQDQVLDGDLPRDTHDLPVDLIATDADLIECATR